MSRRISLGQLKSDGLVSLLFSTLILSIEQVSQIKQMALSHHPKTDNENFSNSVSDGYETILYAVVCDDLCESIKDEK